MSAVRACAFSALKQPRFNLRTPEFRQLDDDFAVKFEASNAVRWRLARHAAADQLIFGHGRVGLQ
jgi:hypothetical protein